MRPSCTSIALLALVSLTASAAEFPDKLVIEAALGPAVRDNGGGRLEERDLLFRLWNESDTVMVHEELVCGVEVIGKDGLFRVVLGTAAPVTADFVEPYWLSVLDCDGTASCDDDPVMDPCDGEEVLRQQLIPVGYSFRAKSTERADWADEAGHAETADRAVRADFADRADSAERADRADSAARADRADHADTATTADRALVADQADHASHADTATEAEQAQHAQDASTLEGHPPADFMWSWRDDWVNETGDSLTGYLTLHADPIQPLHAATKAYVDAQTSGGGGGGPSAFPRGYAILGESPLPPPGFSATARTVVTSAPWRRLADLPTARSQLGVVALGGRLHVIGGHLGHGTLTTRAHEVYDPSTGVWTSRREPALARFDSGLAVVDGLLYVIGGWESSSETTAVEVYDPASDSWSTRAPLPVPRRPRVGVIAGRIHAVGDASVDELEADHHDVYDPATDSWTPGVPLPERRARPAAAVLGDKLYVAGGYTWRAHESVATDSMLVFDGRTLSWSEAAPMQAPRTKFALVEAGGLLYAVGGELPGDSSDDEQVTVEVYDPVTDQWTGLTDRLSPRDNPGAASIDGRVHAVGGQRSNQEGVLAVHEAWDPPIAMHLFVKN